MRPRLPWQLLPLLAGFLLVTTLPAYAAEEGKEAESPLTEVFKWVNFAIVAGGIGWVLTKKAPPFFAQRAREIASGIDRAARLKADADRKRAEAETRLRNLSQEIDALRGAAESESQVEAARLREATLEEAAKVDRAAQAELQAAARAARMELKALAAHLALGRAESLVSAQMTPAAEEGMFQAFVQGLPGSRN